MEDNAKALKQPQSTNPGWYQKIQKAKAARQQGVKAQSSPNKSQTGPCWYE